MAKTATARKASGAGINEIVLPKKLATAVRSLQDPVDTTRDGSLITDKGTLHGLYNEQIRNIRVTNNVTQMLRYLARSEGPFSTALHNMIQVAFNGSMVLAYNVGDNTFSPEGTNLAATIMSQLDSLHDYTEGFSHKQGMDNLIEMMLRETVLTNGIAAELVLTKEQLPDYIQIVPLETIKWYKDGTKAVPGQQVSGKQDAVMLDIPTFMVQRMPGDPNYLYPSSMFESAIKLLIYFEEFLEDVRRVVRGSGHARQVVTLDLEKIKAAAPRSISGDPKKLQEWCETFRALTQAEMENIEPEQAIILFNTAVYEIKSPSFGNKIDYNPMLEIISGMCATAMKTPPSILGMRTDGGGSGVASTETMIFMKTAKALHTPVATIMSRLITLGCRLYGQDVYVKFLFDPIDLRPEMELESFYTMRQVRILTQLSYGFIGDEEAGYLLGTGPRPAGAPPLSGTMFMTSGGAAGTGDGTDGLPVRPGDTPVGKAMQPDKSTPRKAGGASQ